MDAPPAWSLQCDQGQFPCLPRVFSVFFRTNTVSQRKNKKSLLGTVELSKEQDKANRMEIISVSNLRVPLSMPGKGVTNGRL